MIGVSQGKDEIYVNRDHKNPDQWEKYSTLLQGRSHLGCIAYGPDILVTGGWVEDTKARLSSAEAISVVSGTARNIGSLGGVRSSHRLAIIHGRPAVVGGWNGTALATMETYDEDKDAWESLPYSLNES